jgi:hypothetical protein
MQKRNLVYQFHCVKVFDIIETALSNPVTVIANAKEEELLYQLHNDKLYKT